MSKSFKEMLDEAEREYDSFIGPREPLSFEDLDKMIKEIKCIPADQAPPEAIAAVLSLGGFVANMIEQDPSKN